MFNRDRNSQFTLAMGAALLLGACAGAEAPAVEESTQAVAAYNGNGWNGNGWNGLAYNGSGWNGSGWNGSGWNGNGWNGSGWNGSGWNGSGWNGNAWGGTGSAQDCTITPNNDSCTTLHDWVNHTDVNGNGVAGDNDDKGARVQALSYWVSCACPPNVTIPFSDTHGLISTTFSGGLGLAPTWCGSDTSAAVPSSEMEIVSACLMARINMKGKHYPLSLRSLESGTALTTNEKLTHNEPLAWYWGNLWKMPHLDFDSTTFIDSVDLSASGGWWWNMERFSCSAATDVLKDQALYGRDCDSSDCGGHLEFLGDCGSGKKMLGSPGSWDPKAPGNSYYKATAATLFQSAQPGGLASTTQSGGSGGTSTATATYRGRSWRVMTLNRPETLSLEQPLSSFLDGSYGQVQLESGSIPAAQVAYCTLDNPCEGGIPQDQRGRKLLGLSSSQSVSVTLSGNKAAPWNIPGDPNEPMSIAIRYSRPGKLGDGQCDPAGCAQTTWMECASGKVGIGGCIGGIDSSAQLRIWVMNNTPYSLGWSPVHGSISPYGKNIFPATGSATTYSTAYIYPIYTQDALATVDGASDKTPGITYDTLRVWLSGDTANAADAPQLDTAYYLPGPPPGDANCRGPNGCWLFAGPNRSVSVAQNAEYSYTSPPLPGGTYTVRISNLSGDADLYVKANGTAAVNSWDCRPYQGAGTPETCVVTLPITGGYLSAMVRGFSAGTATATLTANN